MGRAVDRQRADLRAVNFGNQLSRRRIASSANITERKSVIGKLVYWNHEKGFGFIARDDRKENNLFVHAVAFPDNTVPELGDMIQCDIQADARDGRERAANASIVE